MRRSSVSRLGEEHKAIVQLQTDDKFAILTIDRCVGAPGVDFQLSDGTEVLSSFPAGLTQRWQAWLGEGRTGALARSNIAIFRKISHSLPGNLDDEHTELKQYVWDIFCLLQLSGPLHYQGASILLGRRETQGDFISQITDLQDFHPTKGDAATAVTLDRFEEAVAARGVRHRLSASPEYARFTRGARIVVEAIAEWHGAERLHQFVRALEALTFPEIQKTRRQFVNRCKALTSGATGSGYVLGQIYDMRSDVEHVHELSRSIQFIPATSREDVALRRTRQAQQLACSAYRRLYANGALLLEFETDDKIRAFWKQDEPTLRQAFGVPLNLLTVT